MSNHNKPYINGNIIYNNTKIMYKYQFRKIDTYDWFCGPGSYIYTHTNTHTHTHTHTHKHTNTGHFIRCTLLVPGWTPFAVRTVLILRGMDWKHSSEILVHIVMIASHSCCRFVSCTSMMRISRSTTSQSCSIGLRSGDCGGHLSKVNSRKYPPHHYTTTSLNR